MPAAKSAAKPATAPAPKAGAKPAVAAKATTAPAAASKAAVAAKPAVTKTASAAEVKATPAKATAAKPAAAAVKAATGAKAAATAGAAAANAAAAKGVKAAASMKAAPAAKAVTGAKAPAKAATAEKAAPAKAAPAAAKKATEAVSATAAASKTKVVAGAAAKAKGKPAAKAAKPLLPAGKTPAKPAAKATPQRRIVEERNGGVLTPPSRTKKVVKRRLNGAVKDYAAPYKDVMNIYDFNKRIVKNREIREINEVENEDGTTKKVPTKREATEEEIEAATAFIEDEQAIDEYNDAVAHNKLASSQTIRTTRECIPAINAIGAWVLNDVVDHAVGELGSSKMITVTHLTSGKVEEMQSYPLLRNSPSFSAAVLATRAEQNEKKLAASITKAYKEGVATTKKTLSAEYGHLRKNGRKAATAEAGAEEGEDAEEAAEEAAEAAPAAKDAKEADSEGVRDLHQGVSQQIAWRLQQIRPDAQLRVSQKARNLLEHLCYEIYESFTIGLEELLSCGDSKTANIGHLHTLVNIHMRNGLIPTTSAHLEDTVGPDPEEIKAETEARKKAKEDGVARETVAHSDLPQIEMKVLRRVSVWPNSAADQLWAFVMNSVDIYSKTIEAHKKKNKDAAAEEEAEEAEVEEADADAEEEAEADAEEEAEAEEEADE